MNFLRSLFSGEFPGRINNLWLSEAIPSKTKISGHKIKLKKYPSLGEVVLFFQTKEFNVFYKCVDIETYQAARSPFADLAYWDNGKEYSFTYHHKEARK